MSEKSEAKITPFDMDSLPPKAREALEELREVMGATTIEEALEAAVALSQQQIEVLDN